jgi:hypothetical protein
MLSPPHQEQDKTVQGSEKSLYDTRRNDRMPKVDLHNISQYCEPSKCHRVHEIIKSGQEHKIYFFFLQLYFLVVDFFKVDHFYQFHLFICLFLVSDSQIFLKWVRVPYQVGDRKFSKSASIFKAPKPQECRKFCEYNPRLRSLT